MILAQVVVMLAESPKSVRVYKAYGAAKALVHQSENYPVRQDLNSCFITGGSEVNPRVGLGPATYKKCAYGVDEVARSELPSPNALERKLLIHFLCSTVVIIGE